ncbi:metalloprotease PmbA [Oleiagrimonas soli]|uniref:Peptidase PmbA n=1 Tax=Oleiagrimonas soli TaxID=1543381 RepID=A0A099CXM9_9GAMM|nr:metalloprotease PmbA [Oleiagrimonas soli]KGI77790.1 peptidase PmbA [Oleiagrimonas soli]MBB6183881.1 PmbA protein [Oleiagrimonas soli]
MNAVVPHTHAAELDRLSQLAEDVVARARAAGASQAEVSASVDAGLSVNVRMGEVETVERTQDRGFGLTVYFGRRKGSASTADLRSESIQATIEQACAIARYTEEDACAGLADAERMATDFPDLDLWHPWAASVDELTELAQRIEDAGRAMQGITNSEGAAVNTGSSLGVYANSHGFLGRESATRHTMSCSLIAGTGGQMQRDYWYDTARSTEQWMDVEDVGREAARRTLARCGARTLSTRQCPVLYAPSVARGLIGHLVGAVSGGLLYRRASFLQDHIGKRILPEWFSIDERPRLLRGQASSNFDSEGVAPSEAALIREGVLQRYVLGSYSARKLGLVSTGSADGPTNLVVGHRGEDFQAMLQRLGTGLLLTEVMGQGVSLITGDYSRGASGFWVENGEIAYPVEEITVAANLRDMFAGIRAVGADVDTRASTLTGSILVDRMTVAGE